MKFNGVRRLTLEIAFEKRHEDVEAERYRRIVLESVREKYGYQSAHAAYAASQLAVTIYNQKRIAEARNLLENALPSLRKHFLPTCTQRQVAERLSKHIRR